MLINQEKNGLQLSKIQIFLSNVNQFILSGGLDKNPDFSTESIEFLFDYYDEMEKEAPITSDLIQTGDFIDDLDGWELWIEGEGIRSTDYLNRLKKDYDEALKLYQKEKKTDWQP